MARGSKSKTIVWALMALLILGLGGFGVTNFSGGVRSIGQVGDQELSTAGYLRAVQDEVRSYEAQTGSRIPMQQARAMQLDQLALARMIAFAALDHEADTLGISVGDDNLRDQLLSQRAFAGVDGTFDREAYRFYLDRTGQTDKQFEEDLRRELSRGLLQAAVLSQTPAGEVYAGTLTAYLAERRDFSWATLDQGDLDAPIPDATDAQLQAWHDAHQADYTLPQRKRITYVWLTPNMLSDAVPLEEADLRALYEARAEQYNTPERRLVERLGFADMQAAKRAFELLGSGDTTFEDLVAARGLDLSDTDMGDVAREDLGTAADAIFAAETGDTVGPFESDIGPALFRVNGTLPAASTSFEDALPELRGELAEAEARKLIDDQMEQIDDEIAAGATLEEVANDTDMELATIDWTQDSSDDAAGYADFQTEAAKITEDDFPQLIKLDDGGILAMRLDSVLPPELQPLEQVRDDVTQAWEDDQIAQALMQKADTMIADITAETDLAALGLTVTQERDITRQDFIPNTPQTFLPTVFEMQPGEARSLPLPAGALIVRLDAVQSPDMDAPEIAATRAQLIQRAAQGRAQDIFQYYINDVQNRAGAQINQTAVDAANTQLQ
ncbi:peptidyl-prolyl cis-trans isomerase [Rhodalgimonas zhirmunskyi]|uniref:SurA N-terminal domain-containing protein n=1 Tax=Rhodalgimonas zhirmunskyi TaxID=2964767 RepID=A0AAJ1U2V7_9RHOB|nr:peptidyl-prolyl cis-trans isomerase [Rhodoalgimonas zhirmunskyi]MDQ2092686.1 SurA N-terminal domain-containing protein [Rhodoalgimonas zhirmunskyi]